MRWGGSGGQKPVGGHPQNTKCMTVYFKPLGKARVLLDPVYALTKVNS